MKAKQISNIHGGQDGAIYGRYLFRFNSKGKCYVYDMEQLISEESGAELICEFMLDRADMIVPHSNAVVFGREFYSEGDEFPLLYTNIYNNYAKADNRRCGMCCVYRLQKKGNVFSSSLVQIIAIGFAEDQKLWRSAGDICDVRPYGNFVVDAQKGIYYAFVMRDGEKTTRYFAFDLPKLGDGKVDGELGVEKVTLGENDIKEYFDTPYHAFIQGACLHQSRIYSVEGFNEKIHPALRIIDCELKKQVLFCDFFDEGIEHEAEMIVFYKERCYYSDVKGALFELEF